MASALVHYVWTQNCGGSYYISSGYFGICADKPMIAVIYKGIQLDWHCRMKNDVHEGNVNLHAF